MNIIDNASLYTGNVCQNGSRFYQMLIFVYPFGKHMRIQRENYDIGVAYIFLGRLCASAVDVSFFYRKVDILLIFGNGGYTISGFLKAH